jgi:outer membrane protein OmpA-like peptidoglycan-associated protein
MDALKKLAPQKTSGTLWVAAAAMLGVLAFDGAAMAATTCPKTPAGAPGPYKVDFAVGSAKIRPENAKTLDEVANFNKTRYSRLCLAGRADKQGNDKANLALSVRRAEAVAAALQKRGVSPKDITVVGRGEAYGDWVNALNQSQADRAVDITLSQ